MDFFLTKSYNEAGATIIYIGVHKNYLALDDYDIMLDILISDCGCSVHSDNYTVYTRIAKLSKDNCIFDFIEDSLSGNYIYVANSSNVSDIEHVADDLIAELRSRVQAR